MADVGQTVFGVPLRSVILFGAVILCFFVLMVLTFDRDVGDFTWVLRWVCTAVWLGFAAYLARRDIVHKKAGTNNDIDRVPFDRWSWIHATAGALMGLWLIPFTLTLIITIAWEFFEKFVPGIGESEIFLNRLVDVGVALLGWVVFAFLIVQIEGGGMPFLWPAADSWIRALP